MPVNEDKKANAFVKRVERLKDGYYKEYKENYEAYSAKEIHRFLGMFSVFNVLLYTFQHYKSKGKLTMNVVNKIVVKYYDEIRSSEEERDAAYTGKKLAIDLVSLELVSNYQVNK